MEFRSVLFVPSVSGMGKDDIVNPKTKNIRLYVKRVFISDDFDGELVRGSFIVNFLRKVQCSKWELTGVPFFWFSSHAT